MMSPSSLEEIDSDPELAALRVEELPNDLRRVTVDSDVLVLQGNRVVEVRNAAVNKGTAASNLIRRRPTILSSPSAMIRPMKTFSRPSLRRVTPCASAQLDPVPDSTCPAPPKY